jgi:hypothetical protein
MVLKLAEVLGPTEASTNVFEDADSKERQQLDKELHVSGCSFGQNRLSGATLPILTLCLCDNMSRLASSWSTLPVSGPPTT